MYGVDPQAFLPGAVIEFARYAGEDIDSPIVTRKAITGSLPIQLESLGLQLQANLAQLSAGANGPRTSYVHEYPLDALKELGRNLVQHRLYEGNNAPARVSWFSNRIIFNNPGRPFGQAMEGVRSGPGEGLRGLAARKPGDGRPMHRADPARHR